MTSVIQDYRILQNGTMMLAVMVGEIMNFNFIQNNDLENARVEKGYLIIEARKEPWEGKNYTSARLITKGKGDWQYGKIEVRARLPKGLGTWPDYLDVG